MSYYWGNASTDAYVPQEIVSTSARNSCVVLLKQQFAAHKQGAAWDGALMTIERVRRTDDAHSLELLYDLYEARIEGCRKNPPPADWNGARLRC
jgi:adenylate cyclase